MTARVLVVDDVLPNVKLLEAKLSSEYFDVITAMNGREALQRLEADMPDIVLLDVMMPEMDGFEVCRRIKGDARFGHIPVVMVTALSDVRDRVHGLEAGADDFLTKPVNDMALYARVRSLVRLKMMMDELRLREATSSNFGVVDGDPRLEEVRDGRILIIEDRRLQAENLCNALSAEHKPQIADSAEQGLALARQDGFELIMVSLSLSDVDGLRLCSQIRSMEDTRHVPLLMLADDSPEDNKRLVKGLELGVNDYLVRPVDSNELLARTRTQLRRRRNEEQLRANYHRSMTLAITDGLTGLYNRRYMESHLESLIQRSVQEQRPVSLQMVDIDNFKPVNDTFGHGAGDEVLREFARRVARDIRGIDLAARYGGEEFVIVMPETGADEAATAAERLRHIVADQPFELSGQEKALEITVSIGVATTEDGPKDAAALLRCADEALYAAKNAGRNRVQVHRC